MQAPATLGLDGARAKGADANCFRAVRRLVAYATLALLVGAAALLPGPAKAVDGCLVLLCLAAPSWRAIPQCVAPVRQLFRDLARGRPFPTCSMSGAGSTASHAWSSAPAFCPPQYTHVVDAESVPYCDYVGAVTVHVDGALFARTWWSLGGDTVTEFTPAAKSALGTWDTRFDDDHGKWLAARPPTAPAGPESGG